MLLRGSVIRLSLSWTVDSRLLRDINVSANLLVKSVPVVQMHMDRVGTVRRPGRLTPALLGDSELFTKCFVMV